MDLGEEYYKGEMLLLIILYKGGSDINMAHY